MSEYVNRHGKKIKVKDDVVEKTPVTSKKPLSATKTSTPRTTQPVIEKPVSSPQTKRWTPRTSSLAKKALLVCAGLILLIVLVGLVTADSTKREYEQQTAAMKRSIFERSKQTSSTDTSTTAVIKSLRDSLSAKTDCRVQGIDVASWYGPAKQARVDCQKTADTYKKLQLSLDDMQSLAQYVENLDTALGTALAVQASGEFAAIGEYNTAWNNAVTALEKLAPPEMAKQTHTEIITKSKAARDAWAALAEANGSRNAESFTAAEKTLNERYSDIRTASVTLRTLVSSTQASINRYILELSD